MAWTWAKNMEQVTTGAMKAPHWFIYGTMIR
jgi:hypothetical protein